MTVTNKMKSEYQIEGMTCMGCVAHVKEALEGVEGVKAVAISLEDKSGEVEADGVSLSELREALGSDKYSIAPKSDISELAIDELPDKTINTYKPLILIVAFIAGVSLITQYPFEAVSGSLWMRHFMAGFFIVFAFFKLLNLTGFADSYAMYDLLAAKWKGWGFLYPFVELGLGLLYLTNIAPFETNVATIIVLGFSSLGVIKSNLDKRQIKCACLGDVFNLPMSTVTIVEDLTMVGMAAVMLL